jgi:hypothetical protein
MASTFSPSLRIELIGDGEQSGIWGQTTNTNLGTLIEQAIAGVVSITMVDANYTLSNFNGVSDEARNAVLVVSGTNGAVRDIIAPLVEKTYIVVNNTTGGYDIRIKTSSGVAVNIPNGTTQIVFCNGTDFFVVVNPNYITGNLNVTGNVAAVGGAFSGNVSALNLSTANVTATGNASVTGNVSAANFIGAGATITSINASNISSGTIANARTTAASANGASTIVLRDTNGSFAGNAVSATTFATTNWSVTESGGFLYFKYGGVNKARLDSSGNFVVTGDLTAFGSI